MLGQGKGFDDASFIEVVRDTESFDEWLESNGGNVPYGRLVSVRERYGDASFTINEKDAERILRISYEVLKENISEEQLELAERSRASLKRIRAHILKDIDG